MKITKFKDIPQFPQAYYRVDVSLSYLKETLDQWNRPETPLILNPEWQRGHVWTEAQQISYMEYFFMNGTSGREIYFNCSSWNEGYNTPVYCLDGLQRITAGLAFLDNKIKVFGSYYREFEDKLSYMNHRFSFNMLNLKNKKQLLKVYLDHNSGGTPHNSEELKRVAKMIEETGEDEIL